VFHLLFFFVGFITCKFNTSALPPSLPPSLPPFTLSEQIFLLLLLQISVLGHAVPTNVNPPLWDQQDKCPKDSKERAEGGRKRGKKGEV